jgi:signal transduction histidine kinase
MYVRTRLALGFIVLVGAMLAVFSTLVFQETRHSLLAEVDRDVRARAQVLAATAGRTPMHVSAPPHLDVFSSPDVYLQLVFTDGTIAASSGNLGDRHLPFFPADATTGVVREAHMGGVPLFLATQAVKDPTGETDGYAVAARTPRTIYHSVARLRHVLVPRAIAGLVLAGLAGWLLTWVSLRPLHRLASSAEEIASSQDHTRRIRVGFLRDEIRKLAITLNQMLDSLEAAYRTVAATAAGQRQFLADASHELRTPLTVVRSALDVLDRVGRDDPEFAAQALGDVREEAERMSRMVNQLLLMARTERRAAVDTRPLLIADLLAEVCRQAANFRDGVTVCCSDSDALGSAIVKGDADYLKQLFLALLDNAVKYTRPGGGVEVTADIEDGNAVVRVSDSGVGIAPDDLPHVFDRFYRSRRASPEPGAGLGLAIVKQIVEMHGGAVRVESELRQGTTVSVSLPLIGVGAG